MSELRLKSTGTLKLFENDNTSNVTIASPASLGADRTITLPDADVTLASGTMLATDGSGASLTALNASELGSGTVPTARLGTGTASSSTFLRGDNSWAAAGGDNTPAFSVYRNAAQSMANAAYTKIEFNAEDYDTDSAFDSSTNYRFTVPVGGAGKYFFSAKARSTAWTSTGARLIGYLNGASKIHTSITNSETADGGYHTVQNTWSMTLADSDYVEIFYWHDNGGAQNIQGDGTDWGLTAFTGFKIIT